MTDIGWEIWQTVRGEFADLPNIAELTRVITRLLVAVVLGGLLGYEREAQGKAAGLRTHMLVALGAAMFVLVPTAAGMEIGDASRVIQGVVAGIGFLGAGAIIKLTGDGRVHGLTTAASIWLTASVGIAAGLGREGTAVVATLLALFILAVLKRFNVPQQVLTDERPPPQDGAASDVRQSNTDNEGVNRA